MCNSLRFETFWTTVHVVILIIRNAIAHHGHEIEQDFEAVSVLVQAWYWYCLPVELANSVFLKLLKVSYRKILR